MLKVTVEAFARTSHLCKYHPALISDDGAVFLFVPCVRQELLVPDPELVVCSSSSYVLRWTSLPVH